MVHGLLVEVASLVERRLSGSGSVVVALGLSCSKITWDLPGPGIQPVSPVPPRSPGNSFRDRLVYWLLVG